MNFPRTPNSRSPQVRSVGLISGGLDSMLAAKIIQDQEIEVHGVHFALPWGCGSQIRAQKAAQQLGIPLLIITADDRFLEIIKKPRYGYGSAINPCIDCHIHMIKQAAVYLKQIDGAFVFTGEVLGQRPMSQLTNSMRAVEKSCGIAGRLLRPLCAKQLPPTIPEEQGLVDRERLLAITGRGRKEQQRLAREFGFIDFPNAAGGCLLTDKNFGNRLRDLLAHGCQTLEETVILRWGRHLRINENFKVIVGRDDQECEQIFNHAKMEDFILELDDRRGPAAVLQGLQPSEEIFGVAAGLVQFFSRYRTHPAKTIEYRPKQEPTKIQTVQATLLAEKIVEGMKL